MVEIMNGKQERRRVDVMQEIDKTQETYKAQEAQEVRKIIQAVQRSIEAGPYVDVYLVRHGRTLWNQQKKYLGHTDIPLLAEAVEELASLRESLREVTFDQIYVSDLVRCIETLRLIAPELVSRSVQDARLREYHFGEYEGKTYEMLQHDTRYRQWIDDPLSVTPPSAETFAHFEKRIAEFAEERITPWISGDRTSNYTGMNGCNSAPKILVVTHGGVIRQWVAAWVSTAEFNTFMPKPGEYLVLRLTMNDGTLAAEIKG